MEIVLELILHVALIALSPCVAAPMQWGWNSSPCVISKLHLQQLLLGFMGSWGGERSRNEMRGKRAHSQARFLVKKGQWVHLETFEKKC